MPRSANSKRAVIKINSALCQGHNRCHSLAPSLFDVDDFGQSSPLISGEIPESLVSQAILAQNNCPEFAIEILFIE